MKFPLFASLAFVLGIGILQAEDKPLTALETLKAAKKLLGEPVGNNMLQIKSENGKLRPRYWWIRYYDPSLFLKLRSIQMVGPEMVKNIVPANPFDGGDSGFIIPTEQLKFDSEKAISFMEKAAKESGIPLHSLNIRLEKPHSGETNPIWYFEWFDEKRRKLGTINVSATTGKITEVVDLKIKTKNIESVSKKGFDKEVEGTFLGIGADLEEFFTGKRTVDKED